MKPKLTPNALQGQKPAQIVAKRSKVTFNLSYSILGSFLLSPLEQILESWGPIFTDFETNKSLKFFVNPRHREELGGLYNLEDLVQLVLLQEILRCKGYFHQPLAGQRPGEIVHLSSDMAQRKKLNRLDGL